MSERHAQRQLHSPRQRSACKLPEGSRLKRSALVIELDGCVQRTELRVASLAPSRAPVVSGTRWMDAPAMGLPPLSATVPPRNSDIDAPQLSRPANLRAFR